MPEWASKEEFERLYKQVNGNGQPGMLQKLDEIHDYVTSRQGVDVHDDKRNKRRLILAGIAATLLAVPIGWCGLQTEKFFSDLYQITQEWDQIHKGEVHQKSFFSHPDPAVSSTQQNSGIGPVDSHPSQSR